MREHLFYFKLIKALEKYNAWDLQTRRKRFYFSGFDV